MVISCHCCHIMGHGLKLAQFLGCIARESKPSKKSNFNVRPSAQAKLKGPKSSIGLSKRAETAVQLLTYKPSNTILLFVYIYIYMYIYL